MKKSVWIFLLAVLLPSVVLGWLALRSAEEQQIVFERRTAELYQKETESLAVTVRDTVDAERRGFGETVHRLLAKGDAEALARDFTNTLADAWEVKAVGFAINADGKLTSPSVKSASKQPELQRFLLGNGGFLTSTEPAIVYNWAGDNSVLRNPKNEYGKGRALANQYGGNSYANTANNSNAGKDASQNNDSTVEAKEVVLLGNSGGGTLNFDTQSNTNGGLGGLEPMIPQTQSNTGVTLGMNAPQMLVLNGVTQSFCQVPPNVNAFDLSSMMSAQARPGNLNGILQPGIAPGGVTALNFPPHNSDGFQQKEIPLGYAEQLVQPDVRPAPMAGGKQETLATPSPARAQAMGSGIVAEREQKDAPAMKPEEKRAPAGDTNLSDRNRNEAGSKMKALADIAKKTAAPGGSSGSDASSGKPITSLRPDSLHTPAAPVSLPEAPAPMPRSEASGADKVRALPTATAPAAAAPAPTKTATARPTVETQAQNFPAPKSQPSAPAQIASRALRKTDDVQGGRSSGETPTDPSALTKAGAIMALNNSISRQVEPQQMLGQQSAAVSSIIPETAEFRSLTEEGDEGLVARFVENKLNLIFWVRPPEAPEMVFGCLVEAAQISDLWKGVMERHAASSRSGRASLESKPEFILALLDDRGKPVATLPADAAARDWKRPFVASEIGEALPHWEAALYLASPTALAESARGLWRTLAFTIAGAVALIALGGWLVVADARRQLALAQQKTDFVSNVSHELKTPLTSIRMFAELMHDRPQPPEKQGQYLRIITVEAERLTRLINNVLDFAKIGRKQKRIEKRPLDLHALVARIWESQELHLREDGFTTKWEAAPGPYPVLGDDDALAQVLVNLLSNAEKYANGNKEVELHTWLDDGWVNVSVLDRGMGVPDGDEKKIFEAFYRAHDSLASGIQGSGLGLTLAQRIAREHGGEIKLEHRDGGGCRFTLRLPLAEGKESGVRGQESGGHAFPDS